VLNVTGRYADPATFEALLERMAQRRRHDRKVEAQAALRQVRDRGLLAAADELR